MERKKGYFGKTLKSNAMLSLKVTFSLAWINHIVTITYRKARNAILICDNKGEELGTFG